MARNSDAITLHQLADFLEHLVQVISRTDIINKMCKTLMNSVSEFISSHLQGVCGYKVVFLCFGTRFRRMCSRPNTAPWTVWTITLRTASKRLDTLTLQVLLDWEDPCSN